MSFSSSACACCTMGCSCALRPFFFVMCVVALVGEYVMFYHFLVSLVSFLALAPIYCSYSVIPNSDTSGLHKTHARVGMLHAGRSLWGPLLHTKQMADRHSTINRAVNHQNMPDIHSSANAVSHTEQATCRRNPTIIGRFPFREIRAPSSRSV